MLAYQNRSCPQRANGRHGAEAPFAVIRLRRCIAQLGTGSCRGDDALKSGVCSLILPLSVNKIFYNRATA